jgi:pSer/pThr/pTyr-binding forkhead associated (FHA) protein
MMIGRMPATYLSEYAQELKQAGDMNFSIRYAAPVLVVQGIAGTLQDNSSGGVSTLVSTGDDLQQASRLIGRVFPLRKSPSSPRGPISVGRTADNDVAIPEYSISKRHCLFRIEGKESTITDCGSTNGTLLNGLPLVTSKPTPIASGNTLVMGRFAFAFYTPASFLALVKQGSR